MTAEPRVRRADLICESRCITGSKPTGFLDQGDWTFTNKKHSTPAGGDDSYQGGPDRDWIYAGAGADNISGGSGDDRVVDASGDDRTLWGFGGDVLFGGSGRDFCNAGSGDDDDVGCEESEN